MQLFPIHRDSMRKWTRESSCKMTLRFRYDKESTDGQIELTCRIECLRLHLTSFCSRLRMNKPEDFCMPRAKWRNVGQSDQIFKSDTSEYFGEL